MGSFSLALALGLLLPFLCNAGFSRHTCAIVEDGQQQHTNFSRTLKCWGLNDVGQAGKAGKVVKPTSVHHVQTNLPVLQVAVGPTLTCAIISAEKNEANKLEQRTDVKCWGLNFQGSGYGILDAPQWSPDDLPAVNLGTDSAFVTQVSIGMMHTCVLLHNGQIKCWGQNQFGQLGLGDNKNRGDHLTGLWPKKGAIRCNNPYFKKRIECSQELKLEAVQLGRYIPVSGSEEKKPVEAKQVVCGYYHTCALVYDPSPDGANAHSTTRVTCWGRNRFGQLGYGNKVDRNQPGVYIDIDPNFRPVDIAAGGFHTCVVLNSGAVKCWGSNEQGALGHGRTGHWLRHVGDQPGEMGLDLIPVNITEPLRALQVSAGIHRTCVTLNNGQAKCWGTNQIHCGNGGAADPVVTGLLGAGYGATKQDEKNMYVGDSPDEVSPDEKKKDKTTIVFDPNLPPRIVAKQILLGVCHTCALLVPSIFNACPPSKVTTTTAGASKAGCSVRPERGKIRCWGNNAFNELGRELKEKVNVVSNIWGDHLEEKASNAADVLSGAAQLQCDKPVESDEAVGCACPEGHSGQQCTEVKSDCDTNMCLYGSQSKCKFVPATANKYGVVMPSQHSCTCVNDLSGKRCQIDDKPPQMIAPLYDKDDKPAGSWCLEAKNSDKVEPARVKYKPNGPKVGGVPAVDISVLENPEYWNAYCAGRDNEVEFVRVGGASTEAKNCRDKQNKGYKLIGDTGASANTPWDQFFISDNTRSKSSKGIRSVIVSPNDACKTRVKKEYIIKQETNPTHFYLCIKDLTGHVLKQFCRIQVVV